MYTIIYNTLYKSLTHIFLYYKNVFPSTTYDKLINVYIYSILVYLCNTGMYLFVYSKIIKKNLAKKLTLFKKNKNNVVTTMRNLLFPVRNTCSTYKK